ncbi:MAG: flavodoxin [Deltaproteobacteria bacterium]|jgi:flavodoxin
MKLASTRRKILLALAIGVAGLLAIPVAVTLIEAKQAREVAPLEPYASPTHADVAVIYFSRSGNTALAARHVAARLSAQLIELRSPDYELGLLGWAHAMVDARGRDADITPTTLDLTGYETIYLGSPVWLYSPAPPIWAFVERNRFDGKHVVLFNTINSEFGEDYIEAFRDAVLSRGARRFEHRFVRRGRMTQQIAPSEMLDAIDAEWELD